MLAPTLENFVAEVEHQRYFLCLHFPRGANLAGTLSSANDGHERAHTTGTCITHVCGW